MKVGDTVTIYRYGDLFHIAKIERETKMFWVVNGDKYRKADGYEAGSSDRRYRIVPTTEAHREEREQYRLAEALRYHNWSRYSLSELKEIFKALEDLDNSWKGKTADEMASTSRANTRSIKGEED